MTTTKKIIYSNVLQKKEDIYATESVCPVCGKSNNLVINEEKPNDITLRNRYTCNNCGTSWYGETYTSNWDKLTTTYLLAANISTVVKIAYVVIMILLSLISPLVAYILVSLNISMFVTSWFLRLYEVKKTGSSKYMDIFKSMTVIAVIAIVIVNL